MSARAVDVAYNILLQQKDGLPFKALWAEVKDVLGYDDKMAMRKASQFYTDLSLDGRFISLENVWNLKSHCKYDDVCVKEEDYEDVEDPEDEDEMESEEEYPETSESDEELSEY